MLKALNPNHLNTLPHFVNYFLPVVIQIVKIFPISLTSTCGLKKFDAYKMPRINDIPEIEVHIMENDEKAGGIGEPGLPPFAPALCNAIFDLTGKRIRKLPFNLEDV